MGVVYKAEDRKLGRSVALKLLRPEMLGDTTNTARFQREARVLASLNHPRIAMIYGFEEQNGTRFLVMEYVAGRTLADRLRGKPLPLQEAILLAELGVVAGYDAEWAQGQCWLERRLQA